MPKNQLVWVRRIVHYKAEKGTGHFQEGSQPSHEDGKQTARAKGSGRLIRSWVTVKY